MFVDDRTQRSACWGSEQEPHTWRPTPVRYRSPEKVLSGGERYRGGSVRAQETVCRGVQTEVNLRPGRVLGPACRTFDTSRGTRRFFVSKRVHALNELKDLVHRLLVWVRAGARVLGLGLAEFWRRISPEEGNHHGACWGHPEGGGLRSRE